MRIKSVGAALLVSVLLTTPLAAAEDLACRYGTPEAWDQVAARFAGPWNIAHHAGFYIAGPMTMPFPASSGAEVMELVLTDSGQLVGTHPEAQGPIPFEWADEPAWSFEDRAKDDGIPGPLLSSEDVELVVGCGVEDLARLIGRTQVAMDGVVMDMTLRLMVVGPASMYGIFHTSAIANGIPVKSWRSVTMSR